MRGHVVTLVLVALTACGGGVAVVGTDSPDAGGSSGGSSGSSGSSGTSGGSSGTSGSSGTPNDGGIAKDGAVKDAAREANSPECPATYGVVPGNCTQGTQCSYGQGRCECAGYCGGAPPPGDVDFTHWTCTATRTDGCPDDAPQSGDPCKIPTAACTYGSCCTQTFICKNSAWSGSGLACPP